MFNFHFSRLLVGELARFASCLRTGILKASSPPPLGHRNRLIRSNHLCGHSSNLLSPTKKSSLLPVTSVWQKKPISKVHQSCAASHPCQPSIMSEAWPPPDLKKQTYPLAQTRSSNSQSFKSPAFVPTNDK